MKRQWHVHREAVEHLDGRQRWDRAYQAILRWSLETNEPALRVRKERRSTMRVAAYVRVSTSRQVKLRTIEQQLEMACKYARQKGWNCRRRTSSATTAKAGRR